MTSRLITRLVPYIAAVTLALTGMQAFAATATITPSQDNTLAEELPDNSSGACDSIFSGNIDDQAVPGARRALIQFDIAGQIPPGSTITSVTLSMAVTRGSNHVDSTFYLHPVTVPWVEGVEGCGVRGGGQGEPSTGGATWTTMNSSYNATSSGETLVNNTAPVWGSTAVMVADVQDWLDNPGNSNGWMVIGDEANPTTTRRFDSREGANPPSLFVTFDLDQNTPVEACCQADGSCSLAAVSSNCSGGQGDGTTCEPNLCPQPTGACCSADRTCSDERRDMCEGDGGTFVGGNCNQADCGLTPFVEALPVPPILAPDNPEEVAAGLKPKYTISVEEAVQSVHPDLPDTTVWTYNGAWPASTIVATKGEPIEVTYINNLPTGGGNRGSSILEVDTCAHGPNDWGDSKRISTHLHGGHLPARFDGQPEYTILPGETDVYQYPNNQDAATVWYHDHALGITRLNVYAGMAGFYLIRDEEDTLGIGQDNAFGLPQGVYEIGLAVQDRTFNEDGSLFYNAQLEDAFKGEYAVVNGKINPYLMVDQGKYRFRLLNGSQSREYIYRLETVLPESQRGNDPSFTLVGTDLGLIDAPLDLGTSTGTVVGPAERLDVVIDFADYPAGTEIILRNDDQTDPLLPSLMKFIVTGNPGYTGTISSTLREVTPLSEASATTRYFNLAKLPGKACKDGSGRLVNEWVIQSLDGPCAEDPQDPAICTNVDGEFWDDLREFPVLGTREVWEFRNPTNSYHPMHVHLVRFQILSKAPIGGGPTIDLQEWEANTWKDIVHIPANTTARIIMDFEDYLGRFPTHCHLLDHEDHEMMRQFQTINPPSATCGDDICDPGEDCQSCMSDCDQVSGAFCGNGLCEAGDGEDCVTCAEDCAGKAKGPFCCGNGGKNPIGCGVDASDDTESNCNNDCGTPPPACVPTETTEVTCDDGQDNDCDGLTDAADPDCQICVPDETSEASCFDGTDNDCDLAVDCSDTDCEGATGDATSCGEGVCAATGNLSCSGGAEVDSCTPLPATELGTEVSCTDGLDNDCDGLADAADPDCGGRVVCTDITVKGDCNNEPTCEWSGSPQNGSCSEIVQCTPDENPEVSCTDGNDNDCNGATDCNDANCSSDPACQTTCNNNGFCDSGEDCNSCASDCDGVTGGKPASRFCCGNGVQEGPEGDGSICDDNF